MEQTKSVILRQNLGDFQVIGNFLVHQSSKIHSSQGRKSRPDVIFMPGYSLSWSTNSACWTHRLRSLTSPSFRRRPPDARARCVQRPVADGAVDAVWRWSGPGRGAATVHRGHASGPPRRPCSARSSKPGWKTWPLPAHHRLSYTAHIHRHNWHYNQVYKVSNYICVRIEVATWGVRSADALPWGIEGQANLFILRT